MDVVVIVAAHNEGERLPATLGALEQAFPGARVIVADDGSTDDTAAAARASGAEVVSTGRDIGKGGAMTLAAARVDGHPTVVLCDGDLGASARHLPELVQAVEDGRADLAIAAFARREGGGFGFAVGFARAATRRLAGLDLQAPISGQRAMRREVLDVVAPFAPRFGMETAMNIDAARAGFGVAEFPLDLEHRATGRTIRGFAHRARQLADFVAVALDRR
jgi:glycosyltransferase involved in cell wall biosynthesis